MINPVTELLFFNEGHACLKTLTLHRLHEGHLRVDIKLSPSSHALFGGKNHQGNGATICKQQCYTH